MTAAGGGAPAGAATIGLGGFGPIALARFVAALGLAVYALTYRAEPGFPLPPHALPVIVATIVALGAMAFVQTLPSFRSVPRAAMGFLAMDAVAAVVLAWSFGFDPRRHLQTALLLVMLEAAAAFGVRGGLAGWAALSVALVAVEARTVAAAGVAVEPGYLALRVLVGGVMAVLTGSLVDQLTGERRRRRLEREARVRHEIEIRRISDLVHGLKAIVWEAGVQRERYTFVSQQVETMLGHPVDAWLSEPGFWLAHVHPEDRQRVASQSRRAVSEGRDHDLEYRVLMAAGPPVWVRDIVHVHLDVDGRAVRLSGLMVDITRQKGIQEEYSYLAYHDPLTGLPNRVMFERMLDLALARARRGNLAAAVLFVDLDAFKTVNDRLGHPAGDDLLRQVAGRLRGAARATDVVARQSGDEFLVLLADLKVPARSEGQQPPSPREVSLAVSARIHAALQHSFAVSGTSVRVSASIGVSIFPVDANDTVMLLEHADRAMYRSKASGSGRTVVYGEDRVWIPGLTLSIE